MGRVRPSGGTPTQAVGAAGQRSYASLAPLSLNQGINPKTAPTWRKWATVEDRKTGPLSTVLTEEEEAAIAARQPSEGTLDLFVGFN